MLGIRRKLAVVAGVSLVGSVLMAPGVAAPTTGRLAGWGYNAFGQLGDRTTNDSSVPVTVDVAGHLTGKRLAAISAGRNHSCAIADGAAYCWGANDESQLGTGNTSLSSTPVPVDTSSGLQGKTVTAISAGRRHSCAVADGSAYCWGDNGFLQLGTESPGRFHGSRCGLSGGVLAGKTVTAISGLYYHSCVLADGQPYCWGENDRGQLGDGTSGPGSRVPVSVVLSGALAGKTVTAIGTGRDHTCALAQGRAYCWGDNSVGQLGTAGSGSPEPVPVATGVLAGKSVSDLSVGQNHTCVLADGNVYCWGDNSEGQLGNPTGGPFAAAPLPVDTSGVLAAKTVTAVDAGYGHTCAVADGQAYCWGSNALGKLGNNTTANSAIAVAVDTSGALSRGRVRAVDAGGNHSLALFATPPSAPTGVTGVAANGHVSVSWQQPADDGGSPIEDYTATASPGGATCTTSGSSCIVSGLLNGTAYTFTVVARNEIGTSLGSLASAPVTPTAPQSFSKPTGPSKPKGLRVSLHRGMAKLTWKPSTGATAYRVRISKAGGKKYKAWNTTTKRVIKVHVTKGRKYRFQVAALGPLGPGPAATIRFRGR